MKLFTFGDSWTEGVGGNFSEEWLYETPIERTNIRHKYSWPTQLSKLLNCELKNNGVGGFSNNAIFNSICEQLKNKVITQNDFVVVMWSSSLRDDLPFFPTENNFHLLGNRYKNKLHLLTYIFDRIGSEHIEYKRAEKNFRDFYINNLYDDTYYNIVNQNYIIHLQFMFNQLGIRYLFCDAFDIMVSKNINELINKTHLINTNRYWGFGDKTMADLLMETKRKDMWDDGKRWESDVAGKHPNKNGYNLIAEELYTYVLNNDILTKTPIRQSYLL